MLTRNQKAELVKNLTERFHKQKVSIFADIRGLSVMKLTQFRRELKNIGAELKVVKKTLLARALDAAGVDIQPKALEGEIGVIFGYEDEIAPARSAAKLAKASETFKLRQAVLGGKILGSQEVLALAELPSQLELLGNLARALNSPIQNLVNALQGNIRNLVVVLSKIKK